MPIRYITVIAVSFFLTLCAGCAELDRNMSELSGTRASPYSMTGMTEQDLLKRWGAPESSYVDSQGNRHLSYNYEQGTNYGSTPRRTQAASTAPRYYGGSYKEKTDTSTRTQSSGTSMRDVRTMPTPGGSSTVTKESASGSSSSHTESTTTGSGIRWSVADPAYSQKYTRGPMCTTTFVVRNGIVQDYSTRGPCQ